MFVTLTSLWKDGKAQTSRTLLMKALFTSADYLCDAMWSCSCLLLRPSTVVDVLKHKTLMDESISSINPLLRWRRGTPARSFTSWLLAIVFCFTYLTFGPSDFKERKKSKLPMLSHATHYWKVLKKLCQYSNLFSFWCFACSFCPSWLGGPLMAPIFQYNRFTFTSFSSRHDCKRAWVVLINETASPALFTAKTP
jgi:hypothetical protein